MNREALLNSFLGDLSLSEFTGSLGAAFGCPVLVCDLSFHVVAAFLADAENGICREAVAHSELPLSLCEALSGFTESSPFASARVGGVSAFPLSSGGIRLGILLFFDGGKIPEKDGFFAAGLAAKQFYADRHAGGVFDTAQEILSELLEGRFEDEAAFSRAAAGTFLAGFSPTAFVLIALPENREGSVKEEHLREELSRGFRASHPFFYRGQLLLFLHEDHDMNLIQSFVKIYRLRAVLSLPIGSLFGLPALYRQAAGTLSYLSRAGNSPFFVRGADYALLTLLSDCRGAAGFPVEKIRKLADYDRENGTELCLTLYTYLSFAHSLQTTAEKLFTHRNTIQYRIRKIKEDFELDPETGEDTLSLLLSLALVLSEAEKDALFIRQNL